MKSTSFMLTPIFIGVLSVISSYSVADAYWTGGKGDFTDDSNWSTGLVPDLSEEDIVINKGQANLVIDDYFSNLNGYDNRLIIGGAQSEKGELNITQIGDGATGYGGQSSLIVGENGGEGIFTYDVRQANENNQQGLRFGDITVGDGAVNGQQSQGTINLLGSGKSPYFGDASSHTLSAASLNVGTDGGKGTVNIDGARLDVDGDNRSENLDVFSIGSGVNSTGEVNVLGGGKLTVSAMSYDVNPGVIGKEGGTGILNISGQVEGVDQDGNPIVYSSRAIFYNGLTVGEDEKSQGFVNIKEGGLLRIFGESTVGKDQGTGSLLVSGKHSRLEILGSMYEEEDGVLTIGSQGGKGLLTIDDGAVVALGHSENGPYESYYQFVSGENSAVNLTDTADSTGTLIIKGSTGQVGVLDSAKVNFGEGEGTLIFNHTDYTGSYEFKPELIGGSVEYSSLINHSGITVLNRDNSQFSGQAYVNGGVLEVNGTLGGDMSINSGGTLAGEGTVGNTTLNAGGFISIGKYYSTAPSVLTVDGNYQGNDGTIIFNTVLGSDSSETDKLVITGDTSGSSYVKVNNLGGLGDQTIKGIELIEVQGASNGVFKSSGRIAAGAYDYQLTRGDESVGANSNNWYLTSEFAKNDGGRGNYLRPESATYLGLLENSLSAFNHSFHDRQQTLNNQYESSWMRVEYVHDKYQVGHDNQIGNKVTRKLFHLGTDLYQKNQFHFGIMTGYSKSDINSRSHLTRYRSTGKSDGYSAGIYATWYDQEPAAGGLYVDSYAQYNWFRNKVSGSGLAEETYNSEGSSFSLESGYGFVINKTKKSVWTIEPQAQVIYGNNSSLNLTEHNGTRLHVNNQKDQLRTRLGIRLQTESEHTQLFLTTNYWNQNKYASVIMDDVNVNNHRARNLFEVKTGLQHNLNKNLQIFTQVNATYGRDSTEAYGASIGVKYKW